MRRTLAMMLTTVALLTATMGAAAPAGADSGDEQWRSYWVDAFNQGIYTQEQVDSLVADALAINANALVVQTVRRYDCFCNDALYPRTDASVSPEPYDPLEAIIEAGHDAGLEVHAWVNVGTMWNSATPHSSPDHAFNAHGTSASGADRWLNKRYDGAELMGNNAFIDPANPAAVEYIVEGIQSIVSNYDVDGINLDYIRYPDYNSNNAYSDWGYSETSIARFQAATGRADVPEPSDEEFGDWRRDQVTNLVRRIYLGIFEIDPQVRLSNDAITYGYGPQSVGGWEATRTYAQVLQDWKGWLEEGILDTAIAMNYKRDWLHDPGNDQGQMFDEWTEVIADWQGDRQAVNGPALYLNDIASSLDQVADIVTPTAAGNVAAGWSGYSYANPSNAYVDGPWEDRSAERDALAAALTAPGGFFEEPAAVPEMTWKTQPTTGNVAGVVTLRDGTPLDQVDLTLDPIVAGGDEVKRVSDGSGWYGFVDVEPGLYFVKVDLPDGVVGQPLTVVRVGAGELVKADLTHNVQLP